MALLDVNNLEVRFYTEDGVVNAVDGVSFCIERGETVGIVGESGAGKSVTALSLIRLIDDPGHIENGEIVFNGNDLLGLSNEGIRRIRGNEIAMVFQDPQTALNPVYSIGEQISEAIRAHLGFDRGAARSRTIELLRRVGIPDAEVRYSDYPHQFSRGMQQRVMIAMGISCEPSVLICDEPTSALDVTIEAQILELLDELAVEFGMAIIMITHDLSVVAELCDRILVMYAGTIVESAPVEALYYDPKHPYTVGLMSSIPRIGDDRDRLETIPGQMPDLIQLPSGCSFHPRCPFAEHSCAQFEPALLNTQTGSSFDPTNREEHAAACLAYSGELEGELGFEVHVIESEVPPDTHGSGTGDSDG